MPQQSPNNVSILEGKGMLSKRVGSPYWNFRFKAYNKWERVSTKERSLKKAKARAVEIYTDSVYRERHGLPSVSKRFSKVANLAIKRIDDLIEAGQGKESYTTYKQVINKYLIPFFGTHNIDNIDNSLMRKFDAWRINEMGRAPSASTINNHNSALNRVFDEAISRNYMAQIQVPVLANDGVKVGQRDDFTIEEYEKIYRGMRAWVNDARAGNELELRRILREYVLVLFNTGIRAGTEGMSIKWKNIKFFTEDGARYLAIDVKGKTGSREVIARHSVKNYLDRLRKHNPDYAEHETFEEFIEQQYDEYVFRQKDVSGDYMTSKFGRIFKRLITSLGVLKHTRTDNDRTLYSLRHTYATLALTYNRMSVHTLAQHLSTSVKMIEKHYGHVILRRQASQIAGKLMQNQKIKY